MLKFKGINHLAMATGDMDKTIRFWRDLPGMRLGSRTPGQPGYRLISRTPYPVLSRSR